MTHRQAARWQPPSHELVIVASAANQLATSLSSSNAVTNENIADGGVTTEKRGGVDIDVDTVKGGEAAGLVAHFFFLGEDPFQIIVMISCPA